MYFFNITHTFFILDANWRRIILTRKFTQDSECELLQQTFDIRENILYTLICQHCSLTLDKFFIKNFQNFFYNLQKFSILFRCSANFLSKSQGMSSFVFFIVSFFSVALPTIKNKHDKDEDGVKRGDDDLPFLHENFFNAHILCAFS